MQDLQIAKFAMVLVERVDLCRGVRLRCKNEKIRWSKNSSNIKNSPAYLSMKFLRALRVKMIIFMNLLRKKDYNVVSRCLVYTLLSLARSRDAQIRFSS